jgi:hypothetical protein
MKLAQDRVNKSKMDKEMKIQESLANVSTSVNDNMPNQNMRSDADSKLPYLKRRKQTQQPGRNVEPDFVDELSVNTINPDHKHSLKYEVKNGRKSPPQQQNALSLDGEYPGAVGNSIKKRRLKRIDTNPGWKEDIERFDLEGRSE